MESVLIRTKKVKQVGALLIVFVVDAGVCFSAAYAVSVLLTHVLYVCCLGLFPPPLPFLSLNNLQSTVHSRRVQRSTESNQVQPMRHQYLFL